MPFTVPLPQDNWKEGEKSIFLREVWTRLKFSSFVWNAPSVNADTTVDTTLTTTDAPQVDGLRAGMPIHVTPPSTIDSGIHITGAWVATDNTLTIRLYNSTALAINPASGSWSFMGAIQ